MRKVRVRAGGDPGAPQVPSFEKFSKIRVCNTVALGLLISSSLVCCVIVV